jgi:hypothetical protein
MPKYVQERSFIATFTSVTPGYEGWLDSIEGLPAERRNQWLTVRKQTDSLQSQQRFWFGYFKGRDEGYQVRTVQTDASSSHYAIWDVGLQNAIGYYLKSSNPIYWRVRVDGVKIQLPEVANYENVTLAAPHQAMFSCATRPSWDDQYVGLNRKHVLEFVMNVEEVAVANFDSIHEFGHR